MEVFGLIEPIDKIVYLRLYHYMYVLQITTRESPCYGHSSIPFVLSRVLFQIDYMNVVFEVD